MFHEKQFNSASLKIGMGIKNLKEGLDPEILAYWYKRIEDKAIESAPSHLKDKIHIKQNRILWMKFRVDISKRVVPYVMQVIDEYIPMMPYSTGLYFRKVQQILVEEMNKELR
ncbi:MAG: hypothetical protein WAM14_24760 [Candidatus Nitrosopolaris sp.]